MLQLSTLLNILYPPPPSLFVNAASILCLTSLASSGLNETKGKHVPYSKFFNSINNEVSVPGRIGMFFAYAPAAAAAAAAAFFLFNDASNPQVQLLSLLLLVHFSKRLFEVVFIHRYSGRMLVQTAIRISLTYTIITVTMIYAQYLSKDLPRPSIDLTYPGLALFFIGIMGNFYHHWLLSRLRQKDDDKGYKTPKGGLFKYAVCPHYLFEIVGFYGVFFVSQTLFPLSFALGSTFYLTGRSLATKKWYRTKFENFPKEVKALIPFVL